MATVSGPDTGYGQISLNGTVTASASVTAVPGSDFGNLQSRRQLHDDRRDLENTVAGMAAPVASVNLGGSMVLREALFRPCSATVRR